MAWLRLADARRPWEVHGCALCQGDTQVRALHTCSVCQGLLLMQAFLQEGQTMRIQASSRSHPLGLQLCPHHIYLEVTPD